MGRSLTWTRENRETQETRWVVGSRAQGYRNARELVWEPG